MRGITKRQNRLCTSLEIGERGGRCFSVKSNDRRVFSGPSGFMQTHASRPFRRTGMCG
jgi:hypothetical protein